MSHDYDLVIVGAGSAPALVAAGRRGCSATSPRTTAREGCGGWCGGDDAGRALVARAPRGPPREGLRAACVGAVRRAIAGAGGGDARHAAGARAAMAKVGADRRGRRALRVCGRCAAADAAGGVVDALRGDAPLAPRHGRGPAGRAARAAVACGRRYARARAVVPFVAAPRGRAAWTIAVAAAAASDALDGPLARRSGATRLGAQLDSTADAAFVTGAAWGAARAGWLGWPAALAPIARKSGGFGLVTHGWFARGAPPELGEPVTRWATGPTALGLGLAGTGAKAAAERLLILASLAALAPTVAALRVPRAQARLTSESA